MHDTRGLTQTLGGGFHRGCSQDEGCWQPLLVHEEILLHSGGTGARLLVTLYLCRLESLAQSSP